MTTQTIRISSIDDFRKLFAAHMCKEDREAFSRALPAEEGHAHMKALADYVFGAGTLNTAQAAHSAAVFPVTVQLDAGTEVVIDSDIVVGPFAASYAIQTDKLTFDRGSLTLLGTTLSIQAKMLFIKDNSPTKSYHVGILGVKGVIGSTGTAGQPYSAPAQNGRDASAPTPGICTGASNGGDGSAGAAGTPGGPGGPGGSGQPSMPATIVISAVDPKSVAPFVLFTQSGAGGDGGTGGAGGKGQTGGAGGHGCDSGCEGTDGGAGGAAGPGGDGGAGGPGGAGVNGYPINITFPQVSKSMLTTISEAAPAGAGGPGGTGGEAGDPGAGGSGGKHKSDGPAGAGAKSGNPGARGTPSTTTGAPGNITVNYI